MSEWFDGFVNFVKGLWTDFIQFVKDIFLELFELLLDGVASVIEAIPVPDFASNGLQNIVSQMPNDLKFFMGQTGIHEGLAILAIGIGFRLVRKFVTLFQW